MRRYNKVFVDKEGAPCAVSAKAVSAIVALVAAHKNLHAGIQSAVA